MTDRESPRGETAKIIGEVAVFCSLSLLGGVLFAVVAFTNINWFYPTLFYGAVVYVAGQRYFYLGEEQEIRELQLGDQRTQGEALRAYFDQMSNLMVDRGLRKKLLREEPEYPEELRIAQARTRTILLELGPERKRLPLQYIYDLSLIMKEEPILSLKNASLDTADLSEITLHDAFLREADLRLANLSGADLSGTDLTGADLRGADLSDANLSNTRLADANLLPYDEKAPAKLNAPNLWAGTDPSDVDLSDDHLVFTNLAGADLSDADLSGAYLIGATVTHEQFDSAASLKGATMPDGSRRL